MTTLHAFRFDCIKNVASKRTPTLRPTLVNPTMKNPKHAAVIAESGKFLVRLMIDYQSEWLSLVCYEEDLYLFLQPNSHVDFTAV